MKLLNDNPDYPELPFIIIIKVQTSCSFHQVGFKSTLLKRMVFVVSGLELVLLACWCYPKVLKPRLQQYQDL